MIIVDECTDISTEKLLGINIKYYLVQNNNIMLQFLIIICVTKTIAEDLYQADTNYLLSSKINMRNLIGVGIVGDSNMCGYYNSLYALLKNNFDLNNLILVKYICHRLY